MAVSGGRLADGGGGGGGGDSGDDGVGDSGEGIVWREECSE